MAQPGGRSQVHLALPLLSVDPGMSHPFPLGSGFSPVKWGCPGLSCGRSALFSFGLKFPSSERYSLTMVIKIAPFPSLQLSPLQRSILFLS